MSEGQRCPAVITGGPVPNIFQRRVRCRQESVGSRFLSLRQPKFEIISPHAERPLCIFGWVCFIDGELAHQISKTWDRNGNHRTGFPGTIGGRSRQSLMPSVQARQLPPTRLRVRLSSLACRRRAIRGRTGLRAECVRHVSRLVRIAFDVV